ncbi:MAG: DUF4337 domain-containing protein [Bacteriovorax sp.]|nr:DUF4337 domain-containing protein [Bacteriovorax sp.]
MNDLTDTIQESIEHSKESKLNNKIAIMVAVSATIMAICNIKDGNIVQAMSQAQAHSIDSWSYFQAKSTKQSIAENSLELLKIGVRNDQETAKQIKRYDEKILKYEKEKGEIKIKAEGFEKEYEDLNVFDDQFDMTEAFISIAIAMLGVTALTQKKWLFYFAGAVSISGMAMGLAAFMKISVHLEWVSKILG